MPLTNWKARQIFDKATDIVRRLFPSRQFIMRSNDRVHCFTLKSWHQIGVVGVVGLVLSWNLIASLAYVGSAAESLAQEESMSRRGREIERLKQSYDAAFRQLSDFQGVFAEATCEVANIQDSLARLAERGLQTAKRGSQTAMPHLEVDATGCRSPSAQTARITASGTAEQDAVRQSIARLESSLDTLRASHAAFLTYTANVTGVRISQLEKTLKSVGLDSRTLTATLPSEEVQRPRFGQGGPFIAASRDTKQATGEIAPVALFNSRATHLDRLNASIRALPLGEPLEDYELTSPFGARNDPINFMTGIHEGVDLGAPEGTPVLATGDGTVVWSGPRDRYGNLVEIDHGMGLHTRYAHLSRVLVRPGQKVGRGTPIGLLGSTGRTTGPHLHYEVRADERATNPMRFIMAGRDVFKGQ